MGVLVKFSLRLTIAREREREGPCCSFSSQLLLPHLFPVEGIARPLPPPTATRTMGGSTDQRAPISATCTSRTPPIQRAFLTAEVDFLTTAVIRQIPTATLTATTPIAARTPMLVAEEHTTLALTGLRPNSAASRTTGSWQSPPVRRNMT